MKQNQSTTDMMGVDDMLLSFGISYLAGNIKEWLSKDIDGGGTGQWHEKSTSTLFQLIA